MSIDSDVLNKRESTEASNLAKHHENIKKYWFHDSVFKSSFFDASSVIIPRGERFVIHSVEKLLHKVHDEKLKEEMTHLIHEETAHSRVHDAYNMMLEREGYNLHLSNSIENMIFPNFEKYLSPMTNLGISMCIEYFTLIFAKHTFEQSVLEDEGVDKRLKRVWIWHNLEEIDHRSGCFDLYQYLDGGYFHRVSCMTAACLVFFPLLHFTHLSLLKQNKGLYRPKLIWRGLKFLFGSNGMYINSMKEWPKFFKVTFAPNQISIKHNIEKKLHHYHIENDLINYF